MPTEARDLKSTIIETDNNKNNLKQAKERINAKLIELGGEEAIDIFNVPEKIQTMSEKYNKLAIIRKEVEVPFREGAIFSINLEIDFSAKRFMTRVTNSSRASDNSIQNDSYFVSKDIKWKKTKYVDGYEHYQELYMKIKSYENNKINIEVTGRNTSKYFDNVFIAFEIMAIS